MPASLRAVRSSQTRGDDFLSCTLAGILRAQSSGPLSNKAFLTPILSPLVMQLHRSCIYFIATHFSFCAEVYFGLVTLSPKHCNLEGEEHPSAQGPPIYRGSVNISWS